jgi:OOP family OmpA-OmpF porin
MMRRGILSSLFVAAVSLSATAQSPPLLKGEEITESALVEALTPQAPLLITFKTNATVLTAEARRELDIVGQALNTSKLAHFKFVIEGHADPRGSTERNLRLSEGRAQAVKQYLVDNQRVSPERLQSVGKGDREPLNAANPAAPENRRVTFVNMGQ